MPRVSVESKRTHQPGLCFVCSLFFFLAGGFFFFLGEGRGAQASELHQCSGNACFCEVGVARGIPVDQALGRILSRPSRSKRLLLAGICRDGRGHWFACWLLCWKIDGPGCPGCFMFCQAIAHGGGSFCRQLEPPYHGFHEREA